MGSEEGGGWLLLWLFDQEVVALGDVASRGGWMECVCAR